MPTPGFIGQSQMVLPSALGATGAVDCHMNFLDHVHTKTQFRHQKSGQSWTRRCPHQNSSFHFLRYLI
jgi:hypothetical protein